MLSSTLPNHSSSSRMNAKARQANPGVHGLNMSCWCKYKAVWLAGRPGTRHFGQHMLAHAEKESSEAQPWEKPIFGVPMAPTEIWQGFAQEHRQALVAEMTDEQGDVLLAALALSAEDDSISTKSTCDLPVHSYSKRMDSLVTQLGYQLDAHAPDLSDHRAAIDYVTSFLFDTMGYAVAAKPLELYSPYRIYMHRVLAQRCGTAEAMAIVLCSLLQRAAKAGLCAPFEIQVGIPAPGNPPLLRASGTQDHADADVKWCTAKDCVLECLEYLKRYFWSWEWDVGARESFMTPARAFLGDFGRAGVGSATVGVMQITGRPFGDLNLALLAAERLSVLYEQCGQQDASMRQMRDMGVLLCHLKRFSKAQEALKQYEAWISKNCPADLQSTIQSMQKAKQGEPVTISKEEATVVEQLIARVGLEKHFSSA